MTHFHVIEGSQGGYMPDSNAVLESQTLADNYAADLVSELEDNAADASESIAVDQWPDMTTITYPDRGEGDLGRIVERIECNENDCEVCN